MGLIAHIPIIVTICFECAHGQIVEEYYDLLVECHFYFVCFSVLEQLLKLYFEYCVSRAIIIIFVLIYGHHSFRFEIGTELK